MINKSFQLLRTNPALTTNIKLVVSSDYKLYLESFDTNAQLSDQKFKHVTINKNNLYEDQIVSFYDGLSSKLAFDVKYDSDNSTVFNTYSHQFDDIYWSGAKAVEDTWYKEDFEYFAPLYIRKQSLPEGFIILRVDDSAPHEVENNDLGVGYLNKDNFNSQIVDKWKCVSLVDMRYQSDFGFFLDKNFTSNTRYPEKSFDLDIRKNEYSKFYGIDYLNGSYVSKSKFLQKILYYEQPHFKLEKEIMESFRSNNLIFPHILNIKFLFNDVPADPINIKNYSLNRYYGFYADKLEFITNLTSYITPELKDGVTLKNNIFGYIKNSVFTPTYDSPFVEGFILDKTYWVQYENDFYKVIRVYKNGVNTYQIISNFDMSGLTFNSVNDRTCTINYESGYNYKCKTIDNPSGYTNYISGYNSNFIIDPYYSGSTLKSMFGDLYLIQIDGVYHVLKNRNGAYLIQSDYAINSFPTFLEYWKGGRDGNYYTHKPIYKYNTKPISYPVYRIRFSDIKDFDFNRVNTHFADFDYEQDKYVSTAEHKLYAVDYSDKSLINKTFMVHPRGEDGQYNVMNVSSEYIADDELYEISFNNLTDIWRKNQSVVKWGFAGSNSNCDYPYKLNNSIDVGDIYNATCDVLSIVPYEEDKNLDYFYRIGNFFSGSSIENKVRYLNQTTNIENDLMEEYSKKFNLNLYLTSNFDYFDYFFKNKSYFTVDEINYIKPVLKYSVFQSGDNYSSSNTLFKGLNISAINVKSISRDSSGKILNIITDYSKNFNDYKFAIILNDVYENYFNVNRISSNSNDYIYENGLSGNTVIDTSYNGIHVILNEKFKNILIVINVKIPIQISYVTINNVSVFGEKFGLYNSKTLDGKSLYYPATGATDFDPALISAANFFDAFDDMNTLSGFESGITYYYVNSLGQSGSTGPINIFNTGNTMKNISDWGKLDPPFIISLHDPYQLETKKTSYIKGAIKGPSTNIYDKYQVYYDNSQKRKYDVVEPLAREMKLNIQENNLNTVYSSNSVSTSNFIYRFNGSYEPIFLDIALFNNTTPYYSGLTLQGWNSNYKFDTSYENFGKIEELIFSKVNPLDSPIKLKNSDSDLPIYPMVDEFGYQFASRFIFNSSWDKDFYIITNSEQNMDKNTFSNLSHVENIVSPIKSV
jgi:hypothetical protein